MLASKNEFCFPDHVCYYDLAHVLMACHRQFLTILLCESSEDSDLPKTQELNIAFCAILSEKRCRNQKLSK